MYLQYHIIILAIIFDLSLSTTNIKESIESSPDQPSTGERVKARLKELGIAEGDLSSLPIHSRKTQESGCPDVTEDVIAYRLDLGDGKDADAVLLHQSVWNIAPEISILKTAFHSVYHNLDTFVPGGPSVFGKSTVWPHLNCLEKDSVELVTAIKEQLIPASSLPYNFSLPFKGSYKNISIPVEDLPLTSLEGEHGQPRVVDDLVYGGQLKNGFFIEAGSWDSQAMSDSIYWETKHGWTGLLVEPDPIAFDFGLTRHRRAVSLQTCLSTTDQAATLYFRITGSLAHRSMAVKPEGEGLQSMGGLIPKENIEEGDDTTKIQCLPLYSILLALDNPTVHHFSLDIEGAELPVLKTVPWDKVDIRTLTVETHFAGQLYPGDRRDVIAYMAEVGYRHIPNAHKGQVKEEGRDANGDYEGPQTKQDDLFVRNDVPLFKEQPIATRENKEEL